MLLATLPVRVISSPVASPRVTLPLRVVLPATSNAPFASIAPPNVDTPVTFILTAVVIPTKLVCADVRIPVTFT